MGVADFLNDHKGYFICDRSQNMIDHMDMQQSDN